MQNRRMRSFLTVVGIFVGVFLIVSLVSVGQGFEMSVKREFERSGSNRMTITPGGMNLGPISSQVATSKLTDKDLRVIDSVSGVDKIVRILSRTAKVEFRDEVEYLYVWGMSTDKKSLELIKNANMFEVDRGKDIEGDEGAKVVLGDDIAQKSFEKKIYLGDSIKINGVEFKVAGIQKKSGAGGQDMIIRTSLDEARGLFNAGEEISMIIATTREGYDTVDVAEEVKRKLRKERNAKEGEEDFMVQTAQQTIESFSSILNVVQIVLIGLAAISLLIGGIGIMNTTYTSILERRKEIGVMKALGASRQDIVLIFLIEAGLIGLVGGFLGICGGIAFGKVTESIFAFFGYSIFKAYLGYPLILGAMAFSFLMGSISGALPAYQASKLSPVEALRS